MKHPILQKALLGSKDPILWQLENELPFGGIC